MALDQQENYRSQGEAIIAVSAKIGCTADSLRRKAIQSASSKIASALHGAYCTCRHDMVIKRCSVKPQAIYGWAELCAVRYLSGTASSGTTSPFFGSAQDASVPTVTYVQVQGNSWKTTHALTLRARRHSF